MTDGVVLDLEWDGNDPDQRLLVTGLGMAARAGMSRDQETVIAGDLPKITFTKADHRWLLTHGHKVGGDIIDVQTLAWCYDERTPLSLDWTVKHYLRIDPDKRLERKAGVVMFRCDDGELVPMADAPIDQLLAYNERDLEVTRLLHDELVRRLQAVGSFDYWAANHQPLARVLLDMELNGLPLDLVAVLNLAGELENHVAQLEAQLKADAELPVEFNLGSPDQLKALLYSKKFEYPTRIKVDRLTMAELKEGRWPAEIPKSFDIRKLGRDYVHGAYELKGLGLKAKVRAPKCADRKCGHERREDCEPSVSGKALKVHYGDNDWVAGLVDWKLHTKALTFLTTWQHVQRDGRVYTHFNQTGTATGRLSSSDPVNLQNVPSRGPLGKRIRSLFVAPSQWLFVNGDYSQLEPRIMAHYSQDPALLRIFEQGLDLYTETMEAVLGERYPADAPERALIKLCFLALGYGAQPPKIKQNLAEAGYRFPLWKVERAHTGLIETYRVYNEWKVEAIEEGKDNGYVTTIAGHRRHLDFSGMGQQWKAERQAVNSKIQGSAADIVDATMVAVAREIPHWKPVLQVHDELMYEVGGWRPQGEVGTEMDLFRKIAESPPFELRAPLEFVPKIIKSWGDK